MLAPHCVVEWVVVVVLVPTDHVDAAPRGDPGRGRPAAGICGEGRGDAVGAADASGGVRRPPRDFEVPKTVELHTRQPGAPSDLAMMFAFGRPREGGRGEAPSSTFLPPVCVIPDLPRVLVTAPTLTVEKWGQERCRVHPATTYVSRSRSKEIVCANT